MIAGRVTLSGDSGLAPIRRRIVDTRGLLQVAGRAGRNTMVRHLRERNRTHPNQLGGRRTNYWARAAAATSFTLVENSGRGGAVEVSSSQIGLALRYHGTGYLPGGVLTPISGTYLTIPATAEAHGKRAREFGDLKFGFALDPRSGRMRAALVRSVSTLSAVSRGERKGRGRAVALPIGPGTAASDGEPIFWLVRQVKQRGDETVLPPEGQIGDEARAAVDEYVSLVAERGGAA